MTPRPRPRAPAALSRPRGFTLVEVLVALVIMAVLAGMAWRGVDALVTSKAGAQAATDRTLALTNGMAQFEYDLSMLTDTGALSPLAFDGASLRMTRRAPEGMQLVMWTLQNGAWQRWASAPTIRITELQDAWLRSQQWSAVQADAMAVLPGVSAWQVYFYRGNGWSNAQSQGDVAVLPNPPSPPASGASGPEGGASAPQARARAIAVGPSGIRIVLTLPQGEITREKLLPPGGAGAAG